MSKKKLKATKPKQRFLLRGLMLLVCAYAGIVATFVICQRQLIYIPSLGSSVTPQKFGVPYEELDFKSQDGTALRGWWLKHADDAPRITLLYCHGNGATLSALAHVAAMFYRFEWNVFMFDYRYYGQSAKGPGGLTEELVHLDTQAAYDFVREHGVAVDNLVIWGHSLGSSIAAWLASRNQALGLVLEGSFPSMFEMARERYPWLLFPSFLLFDKFETGRYVRERTMPLLVVHAERDTVIPLEMGQQVFAAASPPKEWLLVKDINHNNFPDVVEQYKAGLIQTVERWKIHGDSSGIAQTVTDDGGPR